MEPKTEIINYSNETPKRLDKHLSACFPQISRSQIQRLISDGRVLVNSRKPGKTGILLEKGDRIEVTFPPIAPNLLQPETIPLNVLFEDDNLIVLNKPAGMVVHPSAGHSTGTLVHALLDHVPFVEGIGGVMRPGLVHRLDKDTSGIILIAKNDASLQWLQKQFKSRDIEKKYKGLVDGRPPTPSGRILAPIYRDKLHRKKMAIAPQGAGKPAETVYHTIQEFKNHTLLELQPLTGRTHQIRVHLASIGCPISGDRIYGRNHPSLEVNRQFLHASQLTFRFLGEKNTRTFHADLPEDLSALLKVLN